MLHVCNKECGVCSITLSCYQCAKLLRWRSRRDMAETRIQQAETMQEFEEEGE